MPCTYYTAEEERNLANDENRKLAKQVNDLTKKLCLAMPFVVQPGKTKLPIADYGYEPMVEKKDAPKPVHLWSHYHHDFG